MYRFLLTPRWLAGAALAVAAAVVMVFLGNWQLHRYQERSAINHRIDAADTGTAVPLTLIMAPPPGPGTAGPSPGKHLAWTKVTVTGSYDPANEIQVRGRTVDGDVGYEIVTPLRLADGTAVLVDRGWVPPGPGGSAIAAPVVPPAPTGQVTVVGQIHLSESRPTPIAHRDGRLDTRRIAVPRLARELPFPVYGAYVLLTTQTPANDPAFQQIPIDHEDSWQNAGYTVQWWLFALMALFAFGWQAHKEAQGDDPRPATPSKPRPAKADRGGGDRVEEFDRVAEYDRRAAEKRAEPVPTVDQAGEPGGTVTTPGHDDGSRGAVTGPRHDDGSNEAVTSPCHDDGSNEAVTGLRGDDKSDGTVIAGRQHEISAPTITAAGLHGTPGATSAGAG